MATPETDFLKGIRRRVDELRAVINSNQLPKLQAAHDAAVAAQRQHTEARQTSSMLHTVGPASEAEQAERNRYWNAANETSSALQTATHARDRAKAELAELEPLTDVDGALKTARRAHDEARNAERDAKESIASYGKLIGEIPTEIDAIAAQRANLIGDFAKAEARARTTPGSTLPAFPQNVVHLEATLEAKRQTLASATATRAQMRADLPQLETATSSARTQLHQALYWRAMLEFKTATAKIGPVVAALLATDEFLGKDAVELRPTDDELNAARAHLALEIAQ